MSRYHAGKQLWKVKPDDGNGHGHMLYPSDAYYEGNYKDGKQHGQGEYWHPDTGLYRGEWKEGQMHGHGVETRPNKFEYTGQWKTGRKHGKGMMTGPDKYMYSGNWIEGKKEDITGDAIEIYPPSLNTSVSKKEYKGKFKDGYRSGDGLLTYTDGHTYEGGFKEGKRSGKGTIRWPDGNSYMFGVAEFENDQPLDSKGYFRAKTAVIQHSDWIQKRAQGKTKMKKLGGLMRGKAAGWKDRFMVMTQFELSYFMDDPGRTAEGVMKECIVLSHVTGVSLVQADEELKIGKTEAGTCFKVTYAQKADAKAAAAEQVLYVACKMPRNAEEWVKKIQATIDLGGKLPPSAEGGGDGAASKQPAVPPRPPPARARSGKRGVPAGSVTSISTARPTLSSRVKGGSSKTTGRPPARLPASAASAAAAAVTVVSDNDFDSDSSEDYVNVSNSEYLKPGVSVGFTTGGGGGGAPPLPPPRRSPAAGGGGGRGRARARGGGGRAAPPFRAPQPSQDDIYSDGSSDDYEAFDSTFAPHHHEEESIYASNAKQAATTKKEYASIYEDIYGATPAEVKLYERVVAKTDDVATDGRAYDDVSPVDPLANLGRQKEVGFREAVETILEHFDGDFVPNASITCKEQLQRARDQAESFAAQARPTTGPTLKSGRAKSRNLPDTLTKTDIAALNLYTKPTQLYRRLNAALGGYDGAINFANVRHFKPYVKLLINAMKKMPREATRVYRGVKQPVRKLLKQMKVGSIVTWLQFTSTTTDPGVLRDKNFLGAGAGLGERTVFQISTLSGVNMRGCTFLDEEEILLLPGTRFIVDGFTKWDFGVTEVKMRELPAGTTVAPPLEEDIYDDVHQYLSLNPKFWRAGKGKKVTAIEETFADSDGSSVDF